MGVSARLTHPQILVDSQSSISRCIKYFNIFRRHYTYFTALESDTGPTASTSFIINIKL